MQDLPTTSMWSTPDDDQVLMDADCSPSKTCRNMVGITFEGFADDGTDLATAWRQTLERDGKVKDGSSSVHDLVFGSPES